jgi:hypothetical protein
MDTRAVRRSRGWTSAVQRTWLSTRSGGKPFGRTFEAGRDEAGEQRSRGDDRRQRIAVDGRDDRGGRRSPCAHAATCTGTAGAVLMIVAGRFVMRHCRRRNRAPVRCDGFGHRHYFAAVLVRLKNRHGRFCRIAAFHRTARRLHGGGYPLQGQRGQQQPEHQGLEETIHWIIYDAALPLRQSDHGKASYGRKVKPFPRKVCVQGGLAVFPGRSQDVSLLAWRQASRRNTLCRFGLSLPIAFTRTFLCALPFPCWSTPTSPC